MPRLHELKLPPLTHPPQVQRVELQIYGLRNELLGRGRISALQLGERAHAFENAFDHFKAAYPGYTMEQFLRYLISKGLVAATRAIVLKSIPPPRSGRG